MKALLLLGASVAALAASGAAVGQAQQRPPLYVPSSPPAPIAPSPFERELEQHLRSGIPQPARHRFGTIVPEDYPAAAIRARAQGLVGLRMFVGVTGRVEACDVARSSGNPDLDRASCELATRRFRFLPAIAADGRPTSAIATRQIRWILPDDVPAGLSSTAFDAVSPAPPAAVAPRYVAPLSPPPPPSPSAPVLVAPPAPPVPPPRGG